VAQFGTGPTGYPVSTGPPTSTLSVIPREEIRESKRAQRRARRRQRAHWSLKLATWLAALLAAAVVAGLVVEHRDPRWFQQHHLLRITGPGGSAVPPSAVPRASHVATHPAAVVVPTGATGQTTSASYSVAAQHFTVRVVTAAPCWLQVSSPASIHPIFEGVLPSGATSSYPASHSITVQVGASAVKVAVLVKGKRVFSTTPSVAPFTYNFTSAASA